ncbi:ATP-binding protein [Salinibius halmophilus]|uniref:ATP-binding protein n=1 Tax=Salinibius halmophilus TaxID=1853216 RepID=UPI000E661752|nr:ATP-binding protein [Salinibius halmophilus]
MEATGNRSQELTETDELLPLQKQALTTLATANVLINKSYLAELGQYDVLPMAGTSSVRLSPGSDVRIFQVERLVQENKQSVIESMTAAYTAMGAAGYTVFLYLTSDGQDTLFYIGTRGEPGRMLGQNSGELLQETFKGHFPGSKLSKLDGSKTTALLNKLGDNKAGNTVTAVSSVPSLSTEDQEHFMQGLERFIDAAEERVYEGLILAEPVSMQNLNVVRSGFEQVSTQLSTLAKRQYSYGEQDSEAVSTSISEGISHSLGESLGLTETTGTNSSSTTSKSTTHSTSSSTSSPDLISGIAGAGAMGIGALVGGPIGAFAGAQVAGILQRSNTQGKSESKTDNFSETKGHSHSAASSNTKNETETKSLNSTEGKTQTQGTSRQLSFEVVDKGIVNLLDKIDHHLRRVDEAKSHGGWQSAAYFIADSAATTEALASQFLGLTRGSDSSMEELAMTTWDSDKANDVRHWLSQLAHPRLKPSFASNANLSFLTPATFVSSKEMAIQLSLPRKSTSNVVVKEAAAFGRKVQRLNANQSLDSRELELGVIRHLWTDSKQRLHLDLDQLASHTLVTGSTGSGKSNAIYSLLSEIKEQGIPFLVIEPAKGEYKHVLGNDPNVRVLGTNSKFAELLKINPFSFPAQTHVLEHIDRLIEVFNVCWQMHDAMPALLKSALLQSYGSCGWDLSSSTQDFEPNLFPSFSDVLIELESVIAHSDYSDEVKGNYTGALVTRVRSLSNGLNGEIFTADEMTNQALFDHNVIIDLSRVGSQETKSLIMGLLIIKLAEHRAESNEMNQPLQHVTVLEEAHHLLSSSHSDQHTQSSTLAAKSVELLCNAIAEMRTYGEGFIIADQSPGALHKSAIRNSNTKITMRLPDEADRVLAGKSAALSDDQIDELARLPSGVAVVYQSDWLEAVLCKVKYFKPEFKSYDYCATKTAFWNEAEFRIRLAKWLVSPRCAIDASAEHQSVTEDLMKSTLPTQTKVSLFSILNAGNGKARLDIHKDEHFSSLAKLVLLILDCEQAITRLTNETATVAEFSSAFEALISKKIGSCHRVLLLQISHSVLKALSLKSKDYFNLYAAWTTQFPREAQS